jgi:hypothetical protein
LYAMRIENKKSDEKGEKESNCDDDGEGEESVKVGAIG